MNLFLSIYRNCYIRSLIRNNVFKDTIIDIPDIEYLNNNHQYLSLFSNDDKLKYNIYITLEINSTQDLFQFMNNSFKSLVNDIELYVGVDLLQQYPLLFSNDIIDLRRLLHDGVDRLSFDIDKVLHCAGVVMPLSVRELFIKSGETQYNDSLVTSLLLESMLCNLPTGLKVLAIPDCFQLSGSNEETRFRLPDSIVDLRYSGECACLDRFIVPPNKVFEGTVAKASSLKHLDWLRDKQWINKVYLHEAISNRTYINQTNQIPSHIKKIDVYGMVFGAENVTVLESLPHGLLEITCEKMECIDEQQPVGTLLKHHLPHLKRLAVAQWPDRITDGTFPDSLEYLLIYEYYKALDAHVLPSNLKSLNLGYLNQPLEIGSLPNSITNLSLDSFDQPLQTSVLPSQLKHLNMYRFTNTIEPRSLPRSLSTLYLNMFQGTFQHVCALDNLTKLIVHTLNQSIVNVLVNVTKIALSFTSIADNTSLSNTHITDLCLQNLDWNEILTLQDGFLPVCLVKLELTRIDIQSINTIPPSCKIFKRK
ncbi:hypothetical protein CYY_000222 [Polysphondylium violaceum]|uniref:Uncharacterized protein n=1 Tax=Polysphondylium violaceum TaxID=133409 RepID=A0A8J4Q467_9MYCE|nr:hypothetical protein CYY_000222 [Polysphondylium violaceum]